MGGGSRANAQALGGGAYARHGMDVLGKTGYVAPPQALVGGPPPMNFSPWMLASHPLYQAGGYAGNIVNTAAFGAPVSTQGSIHFRPRAEQ
jgi:hypothetical protein